MTRDEIMELANETAGQHWMDEAHVQRFAGALIAAERDACMQETKRLAVLIAAAEREACARVAENGMFWLTIAKAIRARGEK